MAQYYLEVFDLFPEDTDPLKCSNIFTFCWVGFPTLDLVAKKRLPNEEVLHIITALKWNQMVVFKGAEGRKPAPHTSF